MVSLIRGISCFRHMKERAYQGGQFLKPSQMGKRESLQLVGSGDRLPAGAVVFHIIPNLFVRVQFRGIRGKIEKL